MTHTTVINIEYTASAVFFCQVLSFREGAEVKKDINVSYPEPIMALDHIY